MRIQRNNPVKNTVAQQDTATKNRSPLNHAARSPTTSAAIPDQMLSVAHIVEERAEPAVRDLFSEN